MVLSPEISSDLRQGLARKFFAEVHCDLPRNRNGPRVIFGFQLRGFQGEERCDGAKNGVG